MAELPYKSFIHKSGKIISLPKDMHHAQYAAEHPEDFGTSEDELRSHSSYSTEIDELKSGKREWSDSINQFIGKKGFLRSVNEKIPLDAIDPVSQEPVNATHHNITLHDESRSATPEDFIAALHHVRNHLLENMGPHDRAYISIGGFSNNGTAHKFVADKGIKVHPTRAVMELKGIDDLNKYLGIPAKRSREPASPEHVPSSSEILKNMGRKPEEMMQAQWNMIRRIGDSYEPTKFNTLLEKIGAAKKGIILEAGSNKNILGTNPMQLTPEGLRRHLQKFSKHISLEDGGKHIIVRDRNGNKLTTFPKGKIGPKGAIGTLTIVRDHLEKSGVYTRQGNESSGVGAQKRQNVVVDDNQISPEEKQKAEEARLSAKRDWLKTILSGRLKQKKRERLENKRQRIEKALARARKLQSTNPKPEQQELRQYK